MSAIEAASHTSRVLVDGTLVLQVHIEPRFRDAAMRLFGTPGTAMALAALITPETATASKPQSDQAPAITRPRTEAQRAAWDELGPLAKWAVERCADPLFLFWLQSTHPGAPLWTTELARARILEACEVGSRKELDTDAAAGQAFKTMIIQPYGAWLKKQGIAA